MMDYQLLKHVKYLTISRNTIYRWKHLKGKQEILKQNLMAQQKVIMQK
ncbi:putative transposase [Orientia tsutsugamushi str. Gilliam]|uniref:Putative transposase n=1 Tax=Orientia tsutsugamushi str. Gilliam TaxID=1359184 RepID=A0A0F3M9W0_ORITS|nr:putative transposase [Orientia tsutsugamushi str. Gilliam]